MNLKIKQKEARNPKSWVQWERPLASSRQYNEDDEIKGNFNKTCTKNESL